MICRMCLLDSNETLPIFSEEETKHFSVAAIIAQHFWFEPKYDDPISNIVCLLCWQQIEGFHSYYKNIEDTHRKLSERFSVKQESLVGRYKTYQHNADEELQLLYKVEESVFSKNSHESVSDTPECHSVVTVLEIEEHQIEDDNCTDGIDDDHELEELVTTSGIDNDIEEVTHDDGTVTSQIELEVTSGDEKPEMETPSPSPGPITKNIEKNLEEFIKINTATINSEQEAGNKKTESNFKRRKRNRSKSTDQSLTKVTGKSSEVSPVKQRKVAVEYLKTFREDEEKIRQNLKLKCELCGGGTYATFAEVKKHYRDMHQRKGYVVCCNKKLYKRTLVLDHVNRHLNPEFFKCELNPRELKMFVMNFNYYYCRCEVCNKTFADKQCLKNHMLRHESDDAKTFVCDNCPRRFSKQYQLDQHRVIHTPIEERQHLCKDCGKGFPTSNTLMTHRRYVHEKAYGQMCHICAKVIRGKMLFDKHQLEHAGITEPKVQCKTCGAWLKHEFSLRKHMSLHNQSENEHVCSICGKMSPSKPAMRSHMRYAHSSDRPFHCSICDKSFKKALVLKEHMTIHTGEVLYTCPHCPKTFNSSANMHSHRKKIHRKEWEEGRKNRGIPKSELNKIGSNTVNVETTVDSLENCSDNVTVVWMETT